MTISATDKFATLCTSNLNEDSTDNEKVKVAIPRLSFEQSPPMKRDKKISRGFSTENILLKGMIKFQQYDEVLKYIEQFSSESKLDWLRENAGNHVPLMLANAITELAHDEDNDVEDIACTIHLAELRVKQDLACFGYTESLREQITDRIIDHYVEQIVEIINKKSEQQIDKSYVIHELDKHRLVLPFALNYFDCGDCPPPIDWRIYYQIAVPRLSLRKVNKSYKTIREDVFEKFKRRIEIINQKGQFTLEQLTPRFNDEIAYYCSNLRVLFSSTEIDCSNTLGLIINSHKIDFESINGDPLNAENILPRTLINIWSEQRAASKNEWLKRNIVSLHPLLIHELGISTFELNPTLQGFKEAYEYILLGTLRVFLDAECATDIFLQDVPLVLKGIYIQRLLELAQTLSTDFEQTKIFWWERCGASPTFNHHAIKRFLGIYDDEKVNPNPEWIFAHSKSFDPEKKYDYEKLTEFAFPKWLWKKRRGSLLNTLKTLSTVPDTH